MLNKLIKNLIFVSFLTVLATVNVSPAWGSYGLNDTAETAQLKTAVAGATDVPSLVGKIVSSVLGLMGIIFFFIIFYSGFRWMTARGNSTMIDQSKEAILSAAIGLVIILAAYAVTNFVFDNLTTTV